MGLPPLPSSTPSRNDNMAEKSEAPPLDMQKSITSSISIMDFPRTELEEYLPGQVWLKLYYMRLGGATFSSRTTIVKLDDGNLWVHNPGGPLDQEYQDALKALGGHVKFIVAPSDFHHVFVSAWQEAYPEAETYICPGLETKKGLSYNAVLDDAPPAAWKDQFRQVVIRGRMMSEVLFLHVGTKTLLVSALVEYLTDEAAKKDGTEGWWGTWAWVGVLGMRNRARPAVSYRILGFKDKAGVQAKLNSVIEEWGAERVILSHGEVVEEGGAEGVKSLLQQCWSAFLTPSRTASTDEVPPTQ